MSRESALRLVLCCVVLSVATSCGRKGPLYLPDKPGNVVTRPADESSEKTTPKTAPQSPEQQPSSATEEKDQTTK